MTIYVDDLVSYGQTAKPGAERHFGNGKQSCHMSTDGDLEALHLFAEKMGLRRAWFQNEPILGHYDLTPNKRHAALLNGAVEVSRVGLLALCSKHPNAEIRAALSAKYERERQEQGAA